MSFTKLTFIFIASMLLAEYKAAACRPLAKFQKELEGEDVPDLESLFESGRVMGEGSFGKVVAVEWPYNENQKQVVAIKRLALAANKLNKQITDLNNEVSVMKLLGSDDCPEGENCEGAVPANPKAKAAKAKTLKQMLAYLGSSDSAAPSIIDCLIDRKKTRAYVVMELLAGTLDASCVPDTKRECPIRNWSEKKPDQQLIAIGKVANALQTMHSRGLVHDDLKPDNVGALDRAIDDVKLIDFGLSRKAGKSQRGGTDIYMDLPKLRWFCSELNSKNQADADLNNSNPLADVYGLGLIWYAMKYADWAIKNRQKEHDPFSNFTEEACSKGNNANQFYKKIMNIVSDPDMLQELGFYQCTPAVKKGAQPQVCLYQLYFGLIHPLREKRITLKEFISKLSTFIVNYKKVKEVNENSFKVLAKMSIDKAVDFDPELKERLLI